MGTLFGMSIFAAGAAILIDKLYGSLVHSTSQIAEAGRAATFIGTWTGVGVASMMRNVSGSGKRIGERVNVMRRLSGQEKDR